jgi:hypothetical protein
MKELPFNPFRELLELEFPELLVLLVEPVELVLAAESKACKT